MTNPADYFFVARQEVLTTQDAMVSSSGMLLTLEINQVKIPQRLEQFCRCQFIRRKLWTTSHGMKFRTECRCYLCYMMHKWYSNYLIMLNSRLFERRKSFRTSRKSRVGDQEFFWGAIFSDIAKMVKKPWYGVSEALYLFPGQKA